ncbi:hypothetical protein Goshw_001676 [Gossypium schwendimanii]|uniref:Uncharacterized protein n=1 Tax=Gossypium schwendimanii TaxID=34291 RepID=A0A7J9MWM2_GOSSC|nr:hypothetical protein [Gossypium schwendimanii]
MKVRKKDGLVIANFIKNYLRELDNLRNKLLERREVAEIQEKKSCSGIVSRDSRG